MNIVCNIYHICRYEEGKEGTCIIVVLRNQVATIKKGLLLQNKYRKIFLQCYSCFQFE